MYGGVGCLGTPIVRTDAMAIWQTGVTWYQLAPVARLNLIGEEPDGVTGNDIIMALCTLFKSDVLNHAVETVLPLVTCRRNGVRYHVSFLLIRP